MGVRTYVPGIGRFTSPDPIQGGSANDYDYANQDPINETDLNGLCSNGPNGIVACSTRVYRAWRYFHIKHHLTTIGAAALIGNLREESHLNPRQHEVGGFATRLQFVWHELTHSYRSVLHLLQHAHHHLRSVTAQVAADYEMAGTARINVRTHCARKTLRNPRGHAGGRC
jgi:hypothetical protein